MSEDRLLELETKLAFQENTVNELSDQLYVQQRRIEELELSCKYLLNQLTEMADNEGNEGGPANDKPPHY